jgi:hypothetical protein
MLFTVVLLVTREWKIEWSTEWQIRLWWLNSNPLESDSGVSLHKLNLFRRHLDSDCLCSSHSLQDWSSKLDPLPFSSKVLQESAHKKETAFFSSSLVDDQVSSGRDIPFYSKKWYFKEGVKVRDDQEMNERKNNCQVSQDVLLLKRNSMPYERVVSHKTSDIHRLSCWWYGNKTFQFKFWSFTLKQAHVECFDEEAFFPPRSFFHSQLWYCQVCLFNSWRVFYFWFISRNVRRS